MSNVALFASLVTLKSLARDFSLSTTVLLSSVYDEPVGLPSCSSLDVQESSTEPELVK